MANRALRWVREMQCVFQQWLPGTYHYVTTSWSRCPLRHLRYAWDDINSHHTLSKYRQCRCGCNFVCLQFNKNQILQFDAIVLLISFTEVVDRFPPSQLRQLVKLHLLLAISLHARLYHFGQCAHHPAGFVIFAQLAQHCIFIIIIFPILLIVRTFRFT